MSTIDFTKKESEERQLQLFPEETIKPTMGIKRAKESVFNDYEGFVKKFKPKKTTDDCYTPPEIYDTVLEWLGENVDLSGKEIKRPFYPGGDYKSEPYPDNCVVVDNPPFSILSEITNFYVESGVKFFLFAPTLTLTSQKIAGRKDIDITYIICGVTVTYANGATVSTSFTSNLFGDVRLWACHDLYQRIKKVNDEVLGKGKKNLPKYNYPMNVTTPALLSYLSIHGVSLKIRKQDTHKTNALEAQKKVGKTFFGGGFILSDKAAADKAAAEKVAAITWELSESEKQIIKDLNKQ